MTDLITKLETAEAGSRELGNDVLLALGWRPFEKTPKYDYRPRLAWRNTKGEEDSPPNPTATVEQALSLLGKRWNPNHMMWCNGAVSICLSHRSSGQTVSGSGKTPGLAASVALLRAQNKE